MLTLFVDYCDNEKNTVITLAGTCVEQLTTMDEVITALCDLIMQLMKFEHQKVIHNDIKPNNIVKYESHFYLIDFGIATCFSSN